MKKLSKEQSQQHRNLADALKVAHEVMEQELARYNKAMASAFDDLRPAVESLNEAIQHANDFTESVHDEQQEYFDERSDSWREGDTGSEFESWMGDWEGVIEEVEIEAPEELEMPDLDVESFGDLPEEISS